MAPSAAFRRKSEIVDDGTAAQGQPHAVRQFHVGGVQRDEESASQQPVNGPDVGALVRHGRFPLRLGHGTHGPVTEFGEQRRRPFRGSGQGLGERLRRGRPVLQRERCLHGRGGFLDGDPTAVELGNELDGPLGERRLEPDQFGVAAPQSGGIDAHNVLEATDGQVVALPVPRRRRPVRRLGPVDQCQFLERGQDAFHGRHC
jgi:hypothetical protein